MANLPQQITTNQYIADGITSVYNYNFLILQADSLVNDIAVYVTPFGTTPNTAGNLQPLNTAYTVQNVGNLSGGTITFLPGYIPPATATVTITRNMSVSIDTNFSNAQNFNGANLDNAFERVILIMQQLNTYYLDNALSYIISSFLGQAGSNFLPRLPNNSVWVGQNGQVIAAELESNPDTSALRAQLASQAAGGGAGTSLIGYYDPVLGTPQTLNTFLNNLPTYIDSFNNNFRPGDMKAYAGTAVESGWLLCDGAIVNRTTYANLFTAIGTTWGAGDGLTTFALPNLSRRVLVGSGGAGTGELGNAVGDLGGEEDHAQALSEMARHNHPGSVSAVKDLAGLTGSGGLRAYSPTSGSDVNLALQVALEGGDVGAVIEGPGLPANVIQPSAVVNWLIKY